MPNLHLQIPPVFIPITSRAKIIQKSKIELVEEQNGFKKPL